MTRNKFEQKMRFLPFSPTAYAAGWRPPLPEKKTLIQDYFCLVMTRSKPSTPVNNATKMLLREPSISAKKDTPRTSNARVALPVEAEVSGS